VNEVDTLVAGELERLAPREAGPDPCITTPVRRTLLPRAFGLLACGSAGAAG